MVEARSQTDFSVEKLLIAGNRGPCGGVNMALQVAYEVLDIVQGREPVYSNWNLVNNRPIVDELERLGLVNVRNNFDLVPPRSIVLFSAHGVPPYFYDIAQERDYYTIDVTCRLVSRVHRRAIRFQENGLHVVLLGIPGHPETVGTLGHLREENRTLITTLEEAKSVVLPERTALLTQTTLSLDEVKETIAILKQRYPDIDVIPKGDLCYATDNRQDAVDTLIACNIDALVVVGSKSNPGQPGTGSHNSEQLWKKGIKAGIFSEMVDNPGDIDLRWFRDIKKVGITSGASVLDRFFLPVKDWFVTQKPDIEIEWLPQVREEDNDLVFTYSPTTKKAIENLHLRYAA